MKFININTNQKVNNLPRIPGTLNTSWNNSREYYTNEGWRELIEAEIPEGYGVISYSYIDNQDINNTATEFIETDTLENINSNIEADRIANKPLILKEAENHFITLVMHINQLLDIDIGMDDRFLDIESKIENSSAEKIVQLEFALKLRNAWDVVILNGGRFGDVQYHPMSTTTTTTTTEEPS